MKTLACIAVAAAALACPAAAQNGLPDRPSIIVIGNGETEAQPDRFEIGIVIEGRGASRGEALRALSAMQSNLIENLPQVQGLTAGRMTTGDITVSPTHEPTCGAREFNRDTSDCPVVGYSVTSDLTFTGSPAERAGDAISMASELGAARASLNDYALVDMRTLQDAANRAAFLDAERQAQMLAEASGRRIVRILRIQDPSARALSFQETSTGIVVTGARRSLPTAVSIAVAPEPVRATARVTVVFEIE